MTAVLTCTFIYRIEFGEMKTWFGSAWGSGYGEVTHIEVDLRYPDRILYSEHLSLRVVIGAGHLILVGCTSCSESYKEGVGTDAKFKKITGFLQLNTSIIVIVDQDSNCLRLVDKENWQTSQFVGECEGTGLSDGTSAKFSSPHSVIKDLRAPDHLLVTDTGNSAVRRINIQTRNTTTFIKKSLGLIAPVSLTFDKFGSNLFISDSYFIGKFHIDSHRFTSIIGSTDSEAYDGKLSEVRFYAATELVFLSVSVILVVDLWGDRLRLINEANDSVSSICTYNNYNPAMTPASALKCQLYYPRSVMVTDNTIYVGQSGIVSTLPCKWKIPGYE